MLRITFMVIERTLRRLPELLFGLLVPTLLLAQDVRLSSREKSARAPVVCALRNSAIAVWSESHGTLMKVFVREVSPDSGGEIVIAESTTVPSFNVASSGDVCAVAVLGQRSIELLFFGERGIEIGRGSISATEMHAPAMVWNGSEFFFAWSQVRSGSYFRIKGMRFSHTGKPVDSEPFVVVESLQSTVGPNLAALDDSIVLTYRDGSSARFDGFVGTLRSLVLAKDGRSKGPPVGIIPSARIGSTDLAAAPDGIALLVFSTSDYSLGYYRSWIRAIRLDRSGAPLDSMPVVVSDHDAVAGGPAVVWDGGAFLVAWGERRGRFAARLPGLPQEDIVGRRIDVAGGISAKFDVVATEQDDYLGNIAFSASSRYTGFVKTDPGSGLSASHTAFVRVEPRMNGPETTLRRGATRKRP